MKKTAGCMYCDDEVEYVVKDEKIETTVLNETFTVVRKIAFCKNCGHEVFPHELALLNDLIVYDEYRRRKGLLTSQQIKDIRKKRGLSQVELARFIRCGEKNIARYETGTIQDRSFDLLIRLVGDDQIYPLMQKYLFPRKTKSHHQR